MFIIINDRPVDVFRIKYITKVLKIERRTYKDIVSIYTQWCKKTKGNDCYAYKDFKSTDKTDYRFFHTYISRLDDMIRATGDENGVFDVARFKNTGEIEWDKLPDVYFFGITSCDNENETFYGELATDNQLFSHFYESKEEADKALEKLISAINTVRFDALRITI